MISRQSPAPLARLLALGAADLSANGAESPRLAAEFLLAHALGLSPAELRRIVLVRPGRAASADAAERFRAFVARHADGEPVAYIIGEWEFCGIPVFVSPAVLIPRPESETLVRAALEFAREMTAPRIADLGVGSACLTVAVLRGLSAQSALLAVDISAKALAVARRNVLRHRLEDRVGLLRADFTRPFALPRSFDLVLANPPYVGAREYFALDRGVRDFEPGAALVPGSGAGGEVKDQTGLEHIAALAGRCAEMLRPGGGLVMEIGAGQGTDALRIFRERGGWADTRVLPDLAGRDRLIVARART